MEYRVDRAEGRRVPCGMNSIRYIGNSLREAEKVFAATEPGKDMWDKDNASYGVILSRWSGMALTGEYKVIRVKEVV